MILLWLINKANVCSFVWERENDYVACNISWLLLNLWSVALLQQCLNNTMKYTKYNTMGGKVLWVLKWF